MAWSVILSELLTRRQLYVIGKGLVALQCKVAASETKLVWFCGCSMISAGGSVGKRLP